MWGPPGIPDPRGENPSSAAGHPQSSASGNVGFWPPSARDPSQQQHPQHSTTGNNWAAQPPPPPASPGGPGTEWPPPVVPGGPGNNNEWTGPPNPAASGGPAYGGGGGGQPYGFRPAPFPPGPPPPRLEGYGPPPPDMAGHGYGFDPSVPPPLFNRPPLPHGPPFPPALNQAQRPLHGGPPAPFSDQGPPPPAPQQAAGPPPSSAWFQDTHSSNNSPGLASTGGHRFDPLQQSQRPVESCGFGPQSAQSLPNRDYLRQHHQQQRDLPERGVGGGPLLDAPSFPPAAWSRGDMQNQSFVKAPETPQPPPDEDAVQRRQDEQWLRRFLQSRPRTHKTPDPGGEEEENDEDTTQPLSPRRCRRRRSSSSSAQISVPLMQSALYGAAELVRELSLACDALRRDLENTENHVWEDSYAAALKLKAQLRTRMSAVNGDNDSGRSLDALKTKLSHVAKKRAWQRRRRLRQREEKRMEEERAAEKEAEIDKWRTKKIVEVEEKKREQELKLAADSVLSEVLKKQADVKRMLDILRSLEKLRKLRKEAASRKGIFPEAEADQAFEQQLEQLRALIRKRTAVYGAEENMLRVMLEGEQEEERKKDLEKRQRKERDRQLQRRREVEAMLFGDEMPADHLLQPFREYYTQAEHSLPALVQIRREWDVFLVAADHPDGTAIPQGWVLPEAPSDRAWASALEQ